MSSINQKLRNLLKEDNFVQVWTENLISLARNEDENFALKNIKSFRLFLKPAFWEQPNLLVDASKTWKEELDQMKILFDLEQAVGNEVDQAIETFEGYTPLQLVFEWGSFLELKSAWDKSHANWYDKFFGLDFGVEEFHRFVEYDFGMMGLDFLLQKAKFHQGEPEKAKRNIPKETLVHALFSIKLHLNFQFLLDKYQWGGMKFERKEKTQIIASYKANSPILREEKNRLKHQYGLKYHSNFVKATKLFVTGDMGSLAASLNPIPEFPGYKKGDQAVTITYLNLKSLVDDSFHEELVTSKILFGNKNLDPDSKTKISFKKGPKLEVSVFLQVLTLVSRLSRVFIQQIDDEFKRLEDILEKECLKNPTYAAENWLARINRHDPEKLKEVLKKAHQAPEVQKENRWKHKRILEDFDYTKTWVSVPAKVLIKGIEEAINIPSDVVQFALALITTPLGLLQKQEEEPNVRFKPLIYNHEHSTYHWLPRSLAFIVPTDTLWNQFFTVKELFDLNNIQSPIFEEEVRELFRNAGFDVLPEHKYKGKLSGDIDLFVHKDGVFFLGEMKLTERMGKANKEQSWKRNKLQGRAKKQIPKNKTYILSNWEKIATEMGIPDVPAPSEDDIFPFIVSNEFLFDRDPDLPYLKISILELKVLLIPSQEIFLQGSGTYWKHCIKQAIKRDLRPPAEFVEWVRGNIRTDKLGEKESWDFWQRVEKYVKYLETEVFPMPLGPNISGPELKRHLEENRVWAFMDDLPIKERKLVYHMGPYKVECSIPMLEPDK